MGKILILSSDLVGRLKAFSEVTKRLASEGHEVTLMSTRAADDLPWLPSRAYMSLPAKSAIEQEVATQPRRGSRALALMGRLATARGAAERREAHVDRLDPEGVTDLIERHDPDLVLVDIEMPVEIMSAYATGRRLALISDMFSLWHRPGVPPLSSSVVPGRGWRGRGWAIEASWLWFRAWKWAGRLRSRVTRVGLDRRSVQKRVAERTGFPLDAETSTAHWLIPFVYESIPTLVLNALELEFPHQPSAHVSYVGPQVDTSARSPQVAPIPLYGDALGDVLKRRRDGEVAALIYCSFGAVARTDRSALQRVIEAVGDRPGWELIVGLGGRREPHGIESVPDNVHVYEWAPQLEILDVADCAIHHGGTHSINESVLCEAPMVLFPDDELDHNGNAARVAFHGLGVVGDLESDDADTIRSHIAHCLQSSEIRSNLSAMALSVSAYRRERALERAVDALLRG